MELLYLIRDTGDPDHAREVTMDSLPRVTISSNHDDPLSSSDKHNFELETGRHVFKSPLVVRETGMAGNQRM